MSAFFDSRSLAHRSPFGAVEEGTEVLLRIRMPRSWGCSGAQLLIEPDGRPREQWGMFWAGMDGDEHEWWDIRYTPTAPGVYWYGFQVTLALGTGWLVRRSDGTAGYSYESPGPFWQLTCYEKGFTTPDWLAGGVLYQIFPDRFAASGSQKAGVPTDRVLHTSWDEPPHWQPDAQGRIRNNDYAGGDLDGITQKLPYLAGLGVTCLYLNPIFEAHSNHRYDTADYTHIDPLLGDEAALHRLTAEAARHGIRVLLDGVFSHTGADSVYFNREGRYPPVGAYNTPASPYADWYEFKCWPQEYRSWWGFDTLPEVRELSPDFLAYITGEQGVAARWLREGAAGWRLDVADELPDAFLEALRSRVKATDPDALVLGEVWEDASNKESYGHRRRYLLGRQLDSVMNYPFRQAILLFLTQGGRQSFFDHVLSIVENYPPQVLRLLMNHIGTHDTERALTLLGGEPCRGRGRSWQAQQRMTPEQRTLGLQRLRLATLLQFALPGVPCIYYGDEAGMEGYKDPFNRGTYPWGHEDTALLDWYRQLGAARRECPALVEGDLQPVGSGEEVVCFTRCDNGHTLLCAVNRGQQLHTVLLPAPPAGTLIATDPAPHAVEQVLHLPPLSGIWMTLE